MPVHNWLVRHVYMPTLRTSGNKALSMFVVFLFSAAFHELLVSIPFRTNSMVCIRCIHIYMYTCLTLMFD